MSESSDSNKIDRINVKTTTLETYFRDMQEYIGVCKIDIERHEKAALDGAKELLNQKIRDIIYEDHMGYPHPQVTSSSIMVIKFSFEKRSFKPLLWMQIQFDMNYPIIWLRLTQIER